MSRRIQNLMAASERDEKNLEICKKVIDLMHMGVAKTVDDACKLLNYNKKKYQYYLNKLPDLKLYSEQMQSAISVSNNTYVKLAEAALEDRLRGSRVKERQRIFEPDEITGELVLKREIRVEKLLPPSDALIRFVLERNDKELEAKISSNTQEQIIELQFTGYEQVDSEGLPPAPWAAETAPLDSDQPK